MQLLKKTYLLLMFVVCLSSNLISATYNINDFDFGDSQSIYIQYRNSLLFSDRVILFDNRKNFFILNLSEKSVKKVEIENNDVEDLLFITSKNMDDYFLAGYSYAESDSCSPYVCYKIRLVKFDKDGNKLLSKDFDGKYLSFNDFDAENQIYLVTFTDPNNNNFAIFLDKNFNEISKIKLSNYEAINNFIIVDNYLIASFTSGFLNIYSYPEFQLIKTYTCPEYSTITKINNKYMLLAGNYGGLVVNSAVIQVYSISDIINSIKEGSETLSSKEIGLKDSYGDKLLTYRINDNIYLFSPGYNSKKVKLFQFKINENGEPILTSTSPDISLGYAPIPDIDRYKVINFINNAFYVFSISKDESQFDIIPIEISAIKLSESKDIDIDTWETGYPDPLNNPFSFYGKDGYTETINNEKVFKYFDLETAKVNPYISLPVYDVKCDVYLILANDEGIKFISNKGITNDAYPLFSNIEDGFYYDFGLIPLQYIPHGKYFVLIRKAGTNPYDLENPGFILKYIFNW